MKLLIKKTLSKLVLAEPDYSLTVELLNIAKETLKTCSVYYTLVPSSDGKTWYFELHSQSINLNEQLMSELFTTALAFFEYHLEFMQDNNQFVLALQP